MTSEEFGLVRKRMRMRFSKKFVICLHDLSFCVAVKSMVVRTQTHHASLTQAKRDLKKENIRSPNDEWKGYLKTWGR